MYLIIKTIDLIDSLAALCCVLFSSVFCSVEGGELFDRIVSVGRFEEPTAKLLFYQMLVAVKVCYSIIIIIMIMITIIIIIIIVISMIIFLTVSDRLFGFEKCFMYKIREGTKKKLTDKSYEILVFGKKGKPEYPNKNLICCDKFN